MSSQQTKLLSINREVASLAAEVASSEAIALATTPKGCVVAGEAVSLLFSPADLFAKAIEGLGNVADSNNATAANVAFSIRMTALKLKTGDMQYVIESMVAQATWLNALALGLSKYAAQFDDPKQKVIVGEFILKIEATACRILESLATIAAVSHRSPGSD